MRRQPPRVPRVTLAPCLTHDGKAVQSPQERALAWQTKFKAEFDDRALELATSELGEVGSELTHDGHRLSADLVTDLETILMTLPSGTSPGPDAVRCDMLRAAAGAFAPHLGDLFHKVATQAKVPMQWRSGRMTAPKEAAPATNSRGILISDVTGKVKQDLPVLRAQCCRHANWRKSLAFD